jgi:hypothetical protein
MAVRETVANSTRKLQSAVNKVAIWTKEWWIKLNKSKSVHIDFANKIRQQLIFISGTQVRYANTTKYLGLTLEASYSGKTILRKKKRDELNIKFRKMYWLLGRNSELSIHNKLILYKHVICPVWSYGIQLWRCASESNTEVIQHYQNKVLKCTVNASWYIRNSDLHRDLRIKMVTDIISEFANTHENRLQNHINIKASRFLNVKISPDDSNERNRLN